MDFNKIGEYIDKIPMFEEFCKNEKVNKMIEKYSEGEVFDKFNDIWERKHRELVTAGTNEVLDTVDISEDMFLNILELCFPDEEQEKKEKEQEEEKIKKVQKESIFKIEKLAKEEKSIKYEEKKEEIKSRFKRVVNCLGVIRSEYIGKNIYPDSVLDEFKEIYSKYTNFSFNEEKGEKKDIMIEIEKMLSEKFGEREFILTNSLTSAAYLVFETLSKGKKIIMSTNDNAVLEGEKFGISDAIVKAGAELKIVGYSNSIKAEDYLKELSYDGEVALYGDFVENINSSFAEKRAESFEGIKDKLKTLYIGNKIVSENLHPFIMQKGVSVEEILKKEFNIYIFDFSKLSGFPGLGVITADKPIIKKIKENPIAEFVKAGEAEMTIFYLCCTDIKAGKEKGRFEKVVSGLGSIERKNRLFMEKLKYEVGDKAEVEKLTGACLSLSDNGHEEMKIKTEFVSVKINKKSASEVEKELRNSNPIVLCWLNEDTLIFNFALADEKDIDYIVKISAAKIKKSKYIKKTIDKE